MFARVFLVILILHLGFILQGCATDSKDEIGNLQRQIDVLGNELQRINDETSKEITAMKEQRQYLNIQMNKLMEENRKIEEEKQAHENKPDTPPPKHETISTTPDESAKNIHKLKVKVISGDGNIKSANRMAKKLGERGYKIRLIDYAPRSNYLRDTVYFSPKFKSEAKQLGHTIGRNTVLMSLNWPSMYDLIVVTGKNN